VYELFHLSPEIQRLIGETRPKQELRAEALKGGFVTMRQYGWRKVIDGITSIEEVLHVTE
jgi:type II secretory ATPase GspE/PulE/Tfp pilus assembly ATPase PilB-like protein